LSHFGQIFIQNANASKVNL